MAARGEGVSEVAEAHSAGPLPQPCGSVAAHQARLACSAGTQHGDAALAGVEPLRQFAQLDAAPDEGVALRRQVVAHFSQGTPEVSVAQHAVRLLDVGRRPKGGAASAELEDRLRLLNALEPVVAVGLQRRPVGKFAESAVRCFAQQGLAAASQRHDARGHRLGKAVDLERLGTSRDRRGRVLAQGDRAGVYAYPCREPQRSEGHVIVGGEYRGVGRRIEQQKEAVAAVDLSTAMALQEFVSEAIVLGPQARRGPVTGGRTRVAPGPRWNGRPVSSPRRSPEAASLGALTSP